MTFQLPLCVYQARRAHRLQGPHYRFTSGAWLLTHDGPPLQHTCIWASGGTHHRAYLCIYLVHVVNRLCWRLFRHGCLKLWCYNERTFMLQQEYSLSVNDVLVSCGELINGILLKCNISITVWVITAKWYGCIMQVALFSGLGHKIYTRKQLWLNWSLSGSISLQK